MSTKIKSIPTLSGKSAVDFISWAEANEKNPGTVDFTSELLLR